MHFVAINIIVFFVGFKLSFHLISTAGGCRHFLSHKFEFMLTRYVAELHFKAEQIFMAISMFHG